jgi:hypothetical protein
MQFVRWVAAVVMVNIASLAAAADARQSETPVAKVVVMLEGMLEKGKKEMHEEMLQFATYKSFCEDTKATVTKQIATEDQQLELLQADVQKYQTSADDLGREVQELQDEEATFAGDKKAATKVRELERAEYDRVHQDYSESVGAIEKAVAVLKKQAYDREQAGDKSLLQKVMSLDKVPQASKQAIEVFLSRDAEELSLEAAPEALGYEFQSGGVIDMLEKLKDKFIDERSAMEKAEISKHHAYDLLQQDLQASIATSEATISAKGQTKAKDLQLLAKYQGNFEDVTSTRSDDSTYLADVTSSCTQKSNDFESRQTLRAGEIDAVEKAIAILSSDEVAKISGKSSMLQASKGISLAQLRNGNDKAPTNQLRMAAYLNGQSKRIGSRVLSMVAVRATEDPFLKVKNMLRDLITRLEEQAGEEASHKAWCDTELAENEQVRTTRTASVDNMKSEIEELTASIAKGGADITQLTIQSAELDENIAKETAMRVEAKAENEATIQDAKDAQTAVARAVLVLKEFYDKAKAAALFQTQKSKQIPTAPAFGETPYEGMGAANGGVVHLLEVVQADFARLESDTAASEVSQVEAHNKFMTESATTKAQKKSDIAHKNSEKLREQQSLLDRQNDLLSEDKELDTAIDYFEKLKPSCLDAGMSFEERVARRQEEIQSLQEALKILNGEDLAMLMQQTL